MAKKLSRKLRMLRDAEIVDDAEYEELLRLSRSRKKTTRKQKAASMRNLRRGCKKILNVHGSKKKRPGVSKTEQQVKKLRKEISETVRKEQLKAELKDLREQRKQYREAKFYARREPDFVL